VNQRLRDAIKSYQHCDKQPLDIEGNRRAWVLSIRELHYAAEDAWRSTLNSYGSSRISLWEQATNRAPRTGRSLY